MTDRSDSTDTDRPRARSTELTGGEGYTYEDAVVALYLTSLLHEESGPGISGRVTRVAVQQASQGEPLDDIVVDADLGGEPRRLSLQVKRHLVISESDEDFREIIRNALKTRMRPNFRVGIDRYGFIARRIGEERLNALKRIIARAEASTSSTEFDCRFSGEASRIDIELRRDLRTLIEPCDRDQEFDFYRHFVAMRLDELEPNGDRYIAMANRLGQLLAAGPHEAAGFAAALCRHVRVGEGMARVWTRASLLSEARTWFRLKPAPSYATDIETLMQLARSSARDIRNDIGGFAVSRTYLVDAARAAAQRSKFCNLSGLAGCGKSAVLRTLIEQSLASGPVLFLRSDRLGARSWPAFATTLGLQHKGAPELLAEIGATGTAILYIDGLDRIRPEHRGIITDLLHAIEENPALSNWRVVATSREQGLEAFRQWIPASFYRESGIEDVAIPALNDEEARLLADQRPQLRQLLFAGAAVQEIARRPFFAAVLAEQFAASDSPHEPLPKSEIELIAAWWRAGGYNAEPDAVLYRQRAILDIAEAGAVSLGKAVPARRLQPSTIGQIHSLHRDQIIEVVEEGSLFSFAHDIYFEWAFFRLLIDRGASWREALVAAGEPPLLARVMGLFSQHVLETDGAWAEHFRALADRRLRPQWRRAWLLGAADSTRFAEHLPAFEALLASDHPALLIKFLVWFQAERTIPNPMLLRVPSTFADGAALVRAADQLGWPSDLAVWHRVLTWLFAQEPKLPAEALPYVAELFAVVQNLLADIPNALSARIISTAESWLIELEKPPTRPGAEPTTRWDNVPGRGALAETLRHLILVSGRVHREAARRIVEAAIVQEENDDALFRSIVMFSPILAQVCPLTLAELVRHEVFEPLPKEDIEAERQRRESSLELLHAIRAKPEQERTELDRRILAGPFHLASESSYDFDDLGIDQFHRAFFSPSPLHQPFASLFESAPEIARGLVRDIGNRATLAWRQVHEVNAPRFGTPIALQVEFPWGTQQFWGDPRTYTWFLGEGGPQPLEAAFLALTYWAHRRLDAGDDVDEIIRAVLEGHDSWTVLGLASSLALESQHVSATVLALITAQRLWWVDMMRQVNNPGQPERVLGIDLREGMTSVQIDASDYLLKRRFRSHSIRDLAPLFALSRDATLRERFKEALHDFPDHLPFAYEEERRSERVQAELLDRARNWAEWGDSKNYTVERVPDQPDQVAVGFESPSETPERAREREQNSRSLADFAMVGWANRSLASGEIDPQLELRRAIVHARSRDSQDLFDTVASPDVGARQAGVAAVAAVATVFASDEQDAAWAVAVLERVARTREPADLRHYNNPMDPRIFLINAILQCTARGRGSMQRTETLITLAADAAPSIAQLALTALLRLPDSAQLGWNAAVFASELFSRPARGVDEDGSAERSDLTTTVQQARDRALARLRSGVSAERFASLPPAWALKPGRRMSWDSVDPPPVWGHPDFDFLPNVAAPILRQFPIEAWTADATHWEALLTYAQDLVRWTADRLFPSWETSKERSRRGTRLSEWLKALADLLARICVFLPPAKFIERYLSPISHHRDDDAIRFVADFTNSLVCRGVYDATEIFDTTLALLDHCLERMLAERVFVVDSYRAGQVHGFDLPEMIKAFLLVSVRDAPDAKRFANDDWRDLPGMMPIIDKLMHRAGWSAYVMQTYLTLCEQAGRALPIAAFARHVIPNLELQHERPLLWSEASLPARIAGGIQRLAEANYPLASDDARHLLEILDRLVDMGDRRAAALQQSEYFRRVQLQTLTV